MKWLTDYLLSNKIFTLQDFLNKEGHNYSLLEKMKETEQEFEWHGEGNVFIHTDMVLFETFKLFNLYELTLKEKTILVLSAIFHDIGKTLVTKKTFIDNKERIVSFGHGRAGASYLQYHMTDVDNDIKKSVLDIVAYHHEPTKLLKNNLTPYAFNALTKNSSGKLFYLLEIADIKGRICFDKDKKLELLEEFKIFSEEYNCFYEKGNIDDYIINESKESLKLFNFSFVKTRFDLLNQNIFSPYEGIAKHYSSKECIVILLVGLSGSGKSSLAKKLIEDMNFDIIVSPDDYNKGNHKKENRQRAFKRSLEELKKFLPYEKKIVFDATNIREDSRDKIIELAMNYNAITGVIHNETGIIQSIANNKNRTEEKIIPSEIIQEQAMKFEYINYNKFHIYNIEELKKLFFDKK